MSKGPGLAKLSRPRLRHAVARERLFRALDDLRAAPLVWLAGPPGAGKTSLVGSYLEARRQPFVWYQVDAGDADPAAFFDYLRRTGDAKAAMPRFLPEHGHDLPAFTRLFFRQFFGSIAPDTIVVFDNFQEAADASLAAILRDAQAEIPHGITVLVVSRVEPPPDFAELAAREAMGVLGWEELKLTLDETRAMAGLKGVAEDWIVQALHQHAAGWAAGVTLMLERLKRAGSGTGTLPSDTRESVFNYFASLIFDQSPEATQRTLLALAFVPRTTPSLAQHLSGNEEAGKLLEWLHRRNLFTDRRPGAEPVYQFHALFQAFLREKAAALLSAEDRLGAMRRAGLALSEQGEIEAARAVLAQAGCWSEVAALILGSAEALLESGRWQTLSGWITGMPEAVRQADPWLDYWMAHAVAQIDPRTASGLFETVHRRFADGGIRTGALLCLAALVNACVLDHFDYKTVDRWLDPLANALEADADSLVGDKALIAWSALVVGAHCVRPWHPSIGVGLTRLEALLLNHRHPNAALAAAGALLEASSSTSRMDLAERFLEGILASARDPRASPASAGWAMFQVAHNRFLMGAYEESLALFDEVWTLAQRHGLRRVLTSSMTHRFAVEFRILDPSDLGDALARIEALPRSEAPMSRALLACYRARFALVQGHWQTAADHAEVSDAAILEAGAPHHEMIYGLINGEMLLRAGRTDRARELVARARDIIERRASHAAHLPSLLLVEAWLAEADGRLDDRRELLREALRLSQVDYGWCQMRYVEATTAHMFRVALEQDIEADAARSIIRRFRLRSRETDGPEWPWPVKVFTLGRFEVQLNDRPLAFGHKTPKKSLSLLKALVAFGPREVPEQVLVDALWPDEDGDAGHKALSVTLLRLRRLFDDHDVVRLQGGKLSLDRQKCWVDAWSFERSVGSLRLDGACDGTGVYLLERALRTYAGPFLADDVDESWCAGVRERLQAKYIHALGYLGRHLEAQQRCEEAIAWYQRGLDADPLVETFYQGLMRCHHASGRRTEGIQAYRRLERLLSISLGVRPSTQSMHLHQALRDESGAART